MKVFFRVFLIHVVFVFFVSFSAGFAAESRKEYPAAPPAKISKKWRAGYLQGGNYKDYPRVFTAVIRGLSELGWIEKITLPAPKDETDTRKLWAWLADNAKSSYIEFVKDAYYSDNWDKELREKNKKRILGRLSRDRDIDLMFALGTWAGQDLANNDHSVPTAVCSVSDPLRAKIIKSAEDSGYDHIHTRIDPRRYERQIRAFHDVIGFKRLGVAFEDTLYGRSYAAIEDLEKVSEERNFEIVTCYISQDNPSIEADMIGCARELAPKTDAFYITLNSGVTRKSLPQILAALNAHKVPAFSQSGVDEVRQGALLSIAPLDYAGLGKFHAEAVGRIINGAKQSPGI